MPTPAHGQTSGHAPHSAWGFKRRQALGALFLVPAWALSAPDPQPVMLPAMPPAPPPNMSPQLAMAWPVARSPQGYLVSEKFDGVRAVWDGRMLRFRSGRVLNAPRWFLAALPPTPLDGELWLGRGQFDRLSALVRQQEPDDAGWRAVRYQVFDAPAAQTSFAQRLQTLSTALAGLGLPWLVPVAHAPVNDAAALQQRLQQTLSQGGEGLVLHRADALWQAGRSGAVYKFKAHADEEGLVVGHLAGKGRLQGQTGALLIEMPSGQRFALGAGLSDAGRRKPPPLGAWVTYRYRGLTPKGLPRFASYVRLRDPE